MASLLKSWVMTAALAAVSPGFAVAALAQDSGPDAVADGEPVSSRIEAMGPASGLTLNTPWRAGPALASARSGLSAAVLEGRIYAAGGSGLVDPRDDFEVFDPEFGIWSPRPALPEGLERFAMAQAGGRVYVAGGYSADSGPSPVASVWSYDPQANVWQSEPDMPGPKASFSMLAHGGKLYSLGG